MLFRKKKQEMLGRSSDLIIFDEYSDWPKEDLSSWASESIVTNTVAEYNRTALTETTINELFDKIKLQCNTPHPFLGIDYGEEPVMELGPDELQYTDHRYDLNGNAYPYTRKRKMTEEEIKERNMSRATYRLKKETELLKAGALVQEKCNDGDQAYQLLEDQEDFVKFNDLDDYDLELPEFSRETVENNPTFFEKVKPATSMWLTTEELKAFKEFVAKKKPAKKVSKK